MKDKKRKEAPIEAFIEEEAEPLPDFTIEIPKQYEFFKVPRRFGSIPVDELPLGCDPKEQYYKEYPRIALPFQPVERISFGHPELEPNRLFWGDNLHIMRLLPSNSIDLIYLDPPFFSGRNYNVIFGDQNEVRSFTDIWDGGMPGYLIWLNARLLEMKRLLKPTGSIFVHCDYHAAHYLKVELDKMFGYENFRNEIIWKRSTGHPLSIKKFESVTDTILIYSKSEDVYFSSVTQPLKDEVIQRDYKNKDEHGFYQNVDLTGGKGGGKEAYEPFSGTLPAKGRAWAPPRREKLPKWAAEKLTADYEKMNQLEKCYALDKIGLIYWSKNKTPRFKRYLPDNPTRFATNLWDDINVISSQSKERIGYPTQKPEALIERIIQSSSKSGDVVADFFCGGGTTPAVVQRLGRRWIASDISRIAVSITADRVIKVVTGNSDREVQQVLTPAPDISVEHWGVYEVEPLTNMKDKHFRDFIVQAYDGRRATGVETIHGYKKGVPLHVGPASQETQIEKGTVLEFAKAVTTKRGKHQGTMLAWAFAPSAWKTAEKLALQQAVAVDFVKISLVPIESNEFKEHITSKHSEYRNFLKFILPPEVRLNYKRVAPLTYEFDVSESVSLNQGSKIINVQWDFDHKGSFRSTLGYTFTGLKNNKPVLKAKYRFPSRGDKKIACRVQDDEGGQKIATIDLKVR